MWQQLQAHSDSHCEECTVQLEAQYSSSESIVVYISTLQRLAKQLSNLGQVIAERQIISKICCGLPFVYFPVILAWDNMLIQKKLCFNFKAASSIFKTNYELEQRSYQHLKTQRLSQSPPLRAIHNRIQWNKRNNMRNVYQRSKSGRCYNSGGRGHFGKDWPSNFSDSSDEYQKEKHKKQSKDKHSEANVIATNVQSNSISSSEVGCA